MTKPRILATAAGEAYNYPLLLRHLLANVADQSAAEIVSGGRRFGYKTFVDRVTRLATLLDQMGVRAGDTVAVMDWDSHRYLECYFAIPMMGAVLQTVNVRLSPSQIAYTLRDAGASVLLCNVDFDPLWDELCPLAPGVRQVIRLCDETLPYSYEALIEATAPTFCFEDFDENAIATTFHTTGTTGDPKQVFFSHRQIVLHTVVFAATFGMQPAGQGMDRTGVYMPLTPMFHVHAWGLPYVMTMLGVKQVYPGRYDAARLVDLKAREGVTFSHCVPTILRMLLDAAATQDLDLAPWTMIIGGSALPLSLAEEAARAGITTLVGFGMSETGPLVSLARSETGDLRDLVRTGFPVPLVHVRAHDSEGSELRLRAPWLTQGYGTQEASDVLWEGGWLHTGDVVAIDDDGALRIVDRLKDVIKTGGEWVSSIDIEDLLMAEPSVAEAAVIGVPDAKWGERPVAFIVGAAGCDAPSPQQLREGLGSLAQSGRLSRYAVPDRLFIVDALPRTSVGKVDKKALRHIAQDADADDRAA
jgi:fatty-acyl-CoA synthase